MVLIASWKDKLFLYKQHNSSVFCISSKNKMCSFVLKCLERFLTWLLAPFGWVVRKERLNWVALCSGLVVTFCVLFSKSLTTGGERMATLLGSIAYLLLSTAFHASFSSRVTTAIELFTQTYVTLSWVLRCILTLSVSICVVVLSSFVEQNLPWDLIDICFYFGFLVHVVATAKMYRKEDFFGLAEATFDLTLAIALKFSKKKLGHVHYIVVFVITFLCLMYKTRPIAEEAEVNDTTVAPSPVAPSPVAPSTVQDEEDYLSAVSTSPQVQVAAVNQTPVFIVQIDEDEYLSTVSSFTPQDQICEIV